MTRHMSAAEYVQKYGRRKAGHKPEMEAVRSLVEMVPGGRCWVLSQSGRLYGSAGIPDVFCVVNGQAFWVEVKVGKDTLSAAQEEFRRVSELADVPVIVGGVQEVLTFLEY